MHGGMVTLRGSMVAGDFLEIYGGEAQRGSLDAVLTCFFIDTAANIARWP